MSTDHKNPYIGPRTFQKEEKHLFFGRDKEAADLEALVISEKLVLFYAQSGAGKSSLINARLIPSLEDKLFEVLPVARLGGDAPVGEDVGNIYIFNLIRSLQRRETDPELFRTLTLSQFLEKLNEDQDGYFYDPDLTNSLRSTFEPTPWPRILIVDQFEEIFSTNVEAWQKREEFFHQLAQAMQDDPFLWILLVMREDYIAALDPYVHLLPKGLRVRYYMERLSHEAAGKAIRSPVEKLRPYAEGVAEKLAEDLSRVKVQKPDGTTGTEPGQYIEPVQLQVVCYSLWENLPRQGTEITEKDLQEVGDVNQSLGKYYDRRVSEVASAKHVRERQIREWFDQKLITAGGIRNIVLQQPDPQPGELDDEVIRELQSDLVRAEKRGGATWYELTHDRLVEPILNSNKKWFELNLSPLQRQALLWEDQGRNDNWLLRDKAYTEVLPWVDEHQDELTDPEKEFLEACQKQRDQEQAILNEQAKSARRMRISITVISAVAIVAVGFLILAVISYMSARAAEEKTQRQAQFDRALANSVSLREKNLILSLLLGVEAFKGNKELTNLDLARNVLLENTLANPQIEQILSGSSGPVLSAVFSPDGKKIASGSYDKNILLWDVNTHQPVDQLSGDSYIVRSVAYSPDGKTLAAGSEDNTITLWDVAKRQPIGSPLKGHSDAVISVAFSPDGKTLASGSQDKSIILWNVKTGQPIFDQPLSEHKGRVMSVAFSPDGKTLASGSYDSSIILWDPKTGKVIRQLIGEKGPVLSVAFSPDGKTLASGNYGKTILLWNVETGELINQLSGHSDIVRSVAFSPDGRTLASGSSDRTIILWDTATGQQISHLHGHSDLVTSVAFSPDGKLLVSSSGDKTIILWDVEAHLPMSETLNGTDTVFHTGPVLSLTFSRDDKLLASGSVDNTIILWDVKTRKPIAQLSGHSGPIFSVAFSPNKKDAKTLASGGCKRFDAQNTCVEGEVILWDVEKREPIGKPLTWHTDTVNSVAFSPDGKTLASGGCKKIDDQDKCVEGEVVLWNVEKRQPIGQPLNRHTNAVTSVAFSPDGKTLASGGADNTIMLWDAITGKLIRQLSGHTDVIRSVVFSPDGKILASASQDRTIILWDVETGKLISQLSGQLGLITSVAFSPDGKTLASGSYDKTIILWDVEAQQPIGQLIGYGSPVENIAFGPDGKTLASSSFNIILWDVNPQSWIERSCQIAGRNFTRVEWKRYFPNQEYRKTCDQFPPEAIATPTASP